VTTDEPSDTALTQADITALGAAIDETEAHTAWSLEEYEPEPRWWTPARITAAGVVAAVLAIGVAGGVWAWHREGPERVPDVSTPVALAPSTTTPPPPKPPPSPPPPPPPPPAETVTVTAAAPVPTHEPIDDSPIVRDGPSAGDYDQIFLTRLRAQNWVIWDPQSVTMNGRRVCALLGQGATVGQVQTDLVMQRVYPPTEAESFVATARGTYPTCP
jgi:hypothetical protein